MSVLTGRLAVVNGQHTVRNWSIETSSDVQQAYASNTKNMPVRVDGNKDWSGSFSAYGFVPDLLPGAAFLFEGSTDGKKENGCKGRAIVDSVEISIDVEAGGILSYDVSFSGNNDDGEGLVLAALTADIEDSDPPAIASAIGATVSLTDPDGLAPPVPLTDVRTVTISLSADNQEYVSSDTAGLVTRLAGNYDVEISITLYESDPSKVIPPNTTKIVTISTVAGDWIFKWILFHTVGGYEVDREGAALIGYSLSGGFVGYVKIDDEMTEGEISYPGETEPVVWWPPAEIP